MENVPYTPPKFRSGAFHCPQCGAYANQTWGNAYFGFDSVKLVPGIGVARCAHCDKDSLWYKDAMVYPHHGGAPLPNPDLPIDIKADYEEASQILAASPRGAAALLRLSIQKLCAHLKANGKTINDNIADLVSRGLPAGVQKALDVVRVVGNEAVHPGSMDLRDDRETAAMLFALVNMVADRMISEPKRIDELYQSLPEAKRKEIERRDTPKK